MIDANATGYGWRGYYPLGLLDAYARARMSRSAMLPPTAQLFILLGDYMHRHYYGRYYAKAQNLARRLRKAYDGAFEQVDVLVMPTVPFKARPLPPAGCTLDQYVQRATEPGANTCPFNVSGHPALSVPVGTTDGLPVGMMLVGRWGEEGTLIRLASALEQNNPSVHRSAMVSRDSTRTALGNYSGGHAA
jgi:amidase